jgi:protein-tyrosine-phosphatase
VVVDSIGTPNVSAPNSQVADRLPSSSASAPPEREVPDPYSGGPDEFEHVLDLVEEASEGLLDDIRKRHLRTHLRR